MTVRVVARRAGVDLDDVATTTSDKADGVIVFVKTLAILWRRLQKRGIQGVRQISADEVWSAMRFRPRK